MFSYSLLTEQSRSKLEEIWETVPLLLLFVLSELITSGTDAGKGSPGQQYVTQSTLQSS